MTEYIDKLISLVRIKLTQPFANSYILTMQVVYEPGFFPLVFESASISCIIDDISKLVHP